MTNNEPKRRYRKSSRSGGSGGDCVEWAYTPNGVYVRDSKDREGPELLLTAAQWQGLLAAAHSGADHGWIRPQPDGVHLVKDGLRLRFTRSEWTAFEAAIAAGECLPVAVGV